MWKQEVGEFIGVVTVRSVKYLGGCFNKEGSPQVSMMFRVCEGLELVF